MDESWTGLALVQPTRRRQWELRRGEETVAELRLPAVRAGGSARVGDRELTIRVRGILWREHTLLDEATGEEIALVRGRTVELRGVERAEWRSRGRGAGRGSSARTESPGCAERCRPAPFERRARSRS